MKKTVQIPAMRHFIYLGDQIKRNQPVTTPPHSFYLFRLRLCNAGARYILSDIMLTGLLLETE